MMWRGWRVLTGLVAEFWSPLRADVLYSVTDTGVSGRFSSIDAFAINNAGQVTGTSRAGEAFLYDNGQVLELDSLTTFPGGSFASGGLSINDSGQIAGYYSSSRLGPSHAFLYRNGRITDLGTLGGPSSWSSSINSAGQITGVADAAAGLQHAFLYTNGQTIDLGTLPGTSSSKGTGINNAGQIVGTSGSNSAFLYSNRPDDELRAVFGQRDKQHRTGSWFQWTCDFLQQRPDHRPGYHGTLLQHSSCNQRSWPGRRVCV